MPIANRIRVAIEYEWFEKLFLTKINGSPTSGGVVGRADDVETLAEAIGSISEGFGCVRGREIRLYITIQYFKMKIFTL